MTKYDNGKTSIWYKAAGKSHDAILALVQNQGPLAKTVEHLKTTGVLNGETIQVHKGAVGYPRAYETATVLWADPSQTDTFYIECPIDYKGNHFVPPNAIQLDDVQAAKVTRSLSNGGWGDSVPLSANFSPRRGTTLHADYDETTSKTIDSGYFRQDSFDNKRIFRVEGDLLWAIREYAGRNHIDLNKSPQAIYGDKPVFEDPAFEGITINHDANGAGGVPVPLAPGSMKAARPSLWLFPEALYIEYEGLAPGARPQHADLTEVDPAEYVWMRQNRDDRELGIRPPEPPAALDKLYAKDVFLASGPSHVALKYDYNAQSAMYKKLRDFEEKVFGKPYPGQGQRPMAEWQMDGTFKGFRFNWQPLNAPGRSQYAIPTQPVLPNWIEVTGHPGVYTPDPAHLPAEAAEIQEFSQSLVQRRPQVCGSQPAIVIRNPSSKYPRADKQWPAIYTDYQISGGPRYYIDVPKDYKGNVHRPDGAERLPLLQWNDFRASLGDMYEPDWVMPEPTSVPADFKPKKSKKPDQDYFVLGGAALAAYQQFEALKQDADNKRSAFLKSLGDTGSYSYFGNTLSSVEFKTPPGAGWIPSNGWGRNTYEPDASTPEGQKVLQDFAALPERPDHFKLHAMLYPGTQDRAQPYLHVLPTHGLIVVAYQPKLVSQPPQDAKAMHADMFGWLQEEQRDWQNRNPTPPMPQDITDFLQALKPQQLPPPAPKLPGPS